MRDSSLTNGALVIELKQSDFGAGARAPQARFGPSISDLIEENQRCRPD
jgi:hypothetical protein